MCSKQVASLLYLMFKCSYKRTFLFLLYQWRAEGERTGRRPRAFKAVCHAVFNENTNYDFILLSKHTQLIYWTELKTEHVFENFGGECPVALPLIAVSASKTCQHHLETRAAKVWDLVQSDQWNLATQTGQLNRPVCWHDYGQLTRIRTPRRFCKIDQMNYENSPQQIQLCTL